MEVKDFAFELKATDERTIEGMGSVFNNVDNGNDVVLPGAFAKSLQSRKPAMLWQHKQDHVIGVWDDLRETSEGLYAKGRILETQIGNDAYTLAKAGALTGMSIGYGVKDATVDRKSGVRHLKELVLHEISLVTFPMNERATIRNVKSAPENERDFEEFLREAGYPRDAAKIITARGFKALQGRREAGGHGLGGLFDILSNITA